MFIRSIEKPELDHCSGRVSLRPHPWQLSLPLFLIDLSVCSEWQFVKDFLMRKLDRHSELAPVLSSYFSSSLWQPWLFCEVPCHPAPRFHQFFRERRGLQPGLLVSIPTCWLDTFTPASHRHLELLRAKAELIAFPLNSFLLFGDITRFLRETVSKALASLLPPKLKQLLWPIYSVFVKPFKLTPHFQLCSFCPISGPHYLSLGLLLLQFSKE